MQIGSDIINVLNSLIIYFKIHKYRAQMGAPFGENLGTNEGLSGRLSSAFERKQKLTLLIQTYI